ncbi:hypothetical protein [Paenibacillus sp. JDR-2]|uniref:hypothetical protein n=1 Tax=Paenibacillus sp. (strain JDR-2) TaxID=324057 RepID=UPI000166A444|nr:hypothetical protein [Paenibacillus sp. JDR-2]ACT00363.1 hypothetical protein Pjdr2_1699 [Paenibacillus sp. JDR-2]
MIEPAPVYASVSDMVIEHYNYALTPDGQPVIYLKVWNKSKEALTGDFSVQVSRAYNSSQDEYRYKRVGHAVTLERVILGPDKERSLEIRNVPRLRTGDYRAEILFRHLTESQEDQMDFTVTRTDLGQPSPTRTGNIRIHFKKYGFILFIVLVLMTGGIFRRNGNR